MPEHCHWCNAERKPTCTDKLGLSHHSTHEAYLNAVNLKSNPKEYTMSTETTVAPVAAVALTLEEQIAKLMAENAKLKSEASKKTERGLTFKVSEKGALSVYGVGRFPVTLYPEQWAKVLKGKESIESFIEANKGSFSVKAEK